MQHTCSLDYCTLMLSLIVVNHYKDFMILTRIFYGRLRSRYTLTKPCRWFDGKIKRFMARLATRVAIPKKFGTYPMTTLSSVRIGCTTFVGIMLKTLSRTILLRFLSSFLKIPFLTQGTRIFSTLAPKLLPILMGRATLRGF